MKRISLIPKNPVKYLKVAFWTGAIIDGKAFFLFLFPEFLPSVTKSVFNMSVSDTNCQEMVSLRMLVALFDLGWTMLLIWASCRPLERKGIMILTVFPIVTGILILRFVNMFTNSVSVTYTVATAVFVVLFFFFTYSYMVNCKWFTKFCNKSDKRE
jgi:hypothetical protein